ncbi:hypothetical protein NE236_41710 [Actinoallomurus purpureus]|uniref:AAA family ATPase n=1 Tax=Actinoallomurus purpureus TaxID=478114 RepID=UPI002092D547|nr:AAA family ATPase [Actinoallomurus purpureus]MCO6011487.1 hypothetical protein [Actinoallomurus purpureus]
MADDQSARRVHVGGNVSGQVVAGDHNLLINGDGTTVTVHHGAAPPVQRRRHPAARALPRPGAPLFGRETELARLSGLVDDGVPVQVYGPSGVGKSALLRRLMADRAASGTDVVFLPAAGLDVEDIVQELFDACYDSIDYRPEANRLRRLMGSIQALILVDDFAGSAADLKTLLDATPSSDLVVTSTDRTMGSDGRALELPGLPEDAALRLVEAELGRELSDEDAGAARRLCTAARGHPRALIQAAAATRASGAGTLVADADAVARALAAGLDTAARTAFTALRALAGVAVSQSLLGALTGIPDPATAFADLQQARLAEPEGDGYVLAAGPETPAPDAAPADAAGFAPPLVDWVRVARPRQIADAAPVVLRVLGAAVRSGADEPACAIARATAPAFARTLRWGSWRITLALGLEAARALGSAEDIAYFEGEERARKRALGLLVGAAAGGAVGATAVLGHGALAGGKTAGGALAAHPALIAGGVAAAVAATVIGVAVINTGDDRPARGPITTVPQGNVAPPPPPTVSPTHTHRRTIAAPDLTLSATTVTSGEPFTATATGFLPGERVLFALSSGEWGNGGPGYETADSSGRAEHRVEGSPSAGKWTVTASGSTSGRRAEADLLVRAAKGVRLVAPSHVEAGKPFSVTAYGFPSGFRVVVTWVNDDTKDSGDFGPDTANSDGTAGTSTARLQNPGHYTLQVTDPRRGDTDTRSLRVDPAPEQNPPGPAELGLSTPAVRHGDSYTVRPSGFWRNEEVRFTWTGDTSGLITSKVTDDEGRVAPFSVHELEQPGDYRVCATGTRSGRQSCASLKVVP